MATKKINYLKVFIMSVAMSIPFIVSLLPAYGEEEIWVHFEGSTGDILKVEHRTEKGDVIEKKANFFVPLRGLIAQQPFQYALSDILIDSTKDVKYCCPVIHCWVCFKVDVVIGLYKFNRESYRFTFDSLNTMEGGQLKPLDRMGFDSSNSVLRPRTRSYFFAVVQSHGGTEVQVLDEVKNQVWR